MKEIIFGKAQNGKANKLITNEISVREGRCSVNIYEVSPDYEIGDPVPDQYDYSGVIPEVILTFYNKKSLITIIAALRESLEMWDREEIDSDIKKMMQLKEKMREWKK